MNAYQVDGLLIGAGLPALYFLWLALEPYRKGGGKKEFWASFIPVLVLYLVVVWTEARFYEELLGRKQLTINMVLQFGLAIAAAGGLLGQFSAMVTDGLKKWHKNPQQAAWLIGIGAAAGMSVGGTLGMLTGTFLSFQ